MTVQLQLVGRPQPGTGMLLPRPVHFVSRFGTALSEFQPQSLPAHRREVGPRPSCASPAAGAALIEQVGSAGLGGRGGAHFPTATKLRAARAATGSITVVANGAEGEPLSRKDTALLELRPHLVLDGLVCAAEAVGADAAAVWLHESNHAARTAISRALAERDPVEDEPPIRLRTGPDGYLTGESSAVANAITGGAPLPTLRRHRAVLVHNVETLARVALLAYGRPGADSALVSVATAEAIVVLEMSVTDTIRDAVHAAAGVSRMHAALVGGYGGTWVPWRRAGELRLHERSLRRSGLSLGAGVLHPLPAGRCGLQRTAEIANYLAQHSARQCGPCAFGLPALADSLHVLAHGRGGRRARRDLTRLPELVAAVGGRGACHHPDGAARMAASALQTFRADADAHLRGGCLHDS